MDLEALYKVECGMYMVGTAREGRLNGQPVNAIVQVTAEPPKLAVSLNKQDLTCQLCARSGALAVSVLDRQVKKGLTSRFAATYQAKPSPAGKVDGEKGQGAAGAMSVPPLAAPSLYRCNTCGYVYDPAQGVPESGIKPGTAFEELPFDWKCPVCGAPKTNFTALPP